MSAAEKDTISPVFVHEALVEVERRGIDTHALLRDAGIPPAVLTSRSARVTPEMYGALWRRIAERLDDEFFGLDSHGMKKGAYALLCYCALNSNTLGQALSRVLRFLNVVLVDFNGTLIRSDGKAEIHLVDRSRSQRLFAAGAYMLIVYGLASWLTKRRIPILLTCFRAPEPSEPDEYRTLFGPNVEYDAQRNALVLDASLLKIPVRQSQAALNEFLRDAPASFLLKYRDTQSATALVRRAIQQVAPVDWPHFDDLAVTLSLSPSTLRRRLEEEGTPYQTIKDSLRRDIAVQLLQNRELSVAEIGARVGFNETSAFHRAFRKWTGLAPGQFRQSLQNWADE